MGMNMEKVPSDDFERNAILFAAMVGGDIDQDQILNILEQEQLDEDQMNELYDYLMDAGDTINTIDEFQSAVEKIKLS